MIRKGVWFRFQFGLIVFCTSCLSKKKKVDTPSQEELQEALDLMKKAYDIMKKQALDVRKEKEAFDSVAKKLKHVHFASVLKLNV